MLKKILTFVLLPMLFIALFLYFFGVRKIELGNDYYLFMAGVSKNFENWKFTIPNIPTIPKMENAEGFVLILNAFISFVNGFVQFINILITVTNSIVQLLQFVITLVYTLIDWFTAMGDKYSGSSTSLLVY